MNVKRKLSMAIAITAIIALAIAPPAHAQTVTTRTDQASYTPGGSGTLFITIVNNSPTDTLELRNFTIYFPWAGFVDGKWDASNNVSTNLAPYKVLTTSGSPGGGNIYTWSTTFNIPSWFGGSGFGNCPGSTNTRYGIYSSCLLLGTNQNGLRYEGQDVAISMAIATYQAPSLTSMILPIATFAILVIATALLFLAWSSLRRMEPRKPTA